MADRTILSDSQTHGYPPAKRLKIANTADNTSDFTDSNLVESAAYYYGVSYIDEDGNESIISDIANVVITAQGQAVSKEDAVARAVAWLQNSQKANGSWGETGKQILATSQALNGLKLANVQNAGIYYGLFFLRGNRADNTDYLARKIITLFNHGQNIDEIVNSLILKSYIWKARIYGWGVNKLYMVDALNTALATKALACIQTGLKDSQGNSLTDQCKLALDNWGSLQSSENKKYGWKPKEDISPFVSASVYSVTTPNTGITDWLTQLQQTNGSFKDNTIDTAGVLIWQNNIVNNKEKAYEFLISKQNINGSWGDDPYLTGLCLEALLK